MEFLHYKHLLPNIDTRFYYRVCKPQEKGSAFASSSRVKFENMAC